MPVSLHTKGETVQKVLADLGSQTHAQLAARGPVANEIIVASFDDVPLKEALSRLANATMGKWGQTGSEMVLARSEALVNAEQEREQAEAIKELKAGIELRLKNLMLQGDLDDRNSSLLIHQLGEAARGAETERHNPKLVGNTPVLRLAARLLASLSDADIKLAVSQTSVTFSNKPKGFQRSLSGDSSPALAAYAHERDAWSRGLTASPGAIEYEVSLAAEGRKPMYVDTGPPDFGSRWNRSAPVEKVRIRITSGSGFSVQLSDAKGNVIDEESDSVSPRMEGERSAEPSKSEPTGPALEISAGTKAFIEALSADWDLTGNPAAIPSDIRHVMLNPDKVEPISLVAGPVLTACASSRREKLIACVTDDMAAGAAMWIDWDSKPDAAEVLARFTERDEVVKESAGWLELDLAKPLARFSRRDLGTLLRTVETEGNIRVAPLAAYSESERELSHYPFMLLEILPRHSFQYEVVGQDWDGLRLLGLLSPQQVASAEGQGLPLGSAPAEFVRRIQASLAEADISDMRKPFGRDRGVEFDDIFADASEALPNGIDLTAWVTIELKDSPCVFGTNEPKPEQVARWEGISGGQIQHALGDPASKLDEKLFSTGRTSEITITIHYNRNYYSESLLTDRAFLGQPFDLTHPPDGFSDFLQQVIRAEGRGGQ